MKPYIIVFNKEITDIDKLFGFQIMNREQAKTFMKAVKRLENEASEFEICGDYYEYSYSDFDIQSISQTDLKVLSKIFILNQVLNSKLLLIKIMVVKSKMIVNINLIILVFIFHLQFSSFYKKNCSYKKYI